MIVSSNTFPVDDYQLQFPQFKDIVVGQSAQGGFNPEKKGKGRMGWGSCNTFFKWRCGRPRVSTKKAVDNQYT
ncbi:hypothetical protein ScPMuIL_015200 [Solemya velum]